MFNPVALFDEMLVMLSPFSFVQDIVGGINIKQSPSTAPDIFSSFTEVLQRYCSSSSHPPIITKSGGKRSSFQSNMKLLAVLLCAGASQAFLVRREAEADPEAEPGYGYSQGAVSAPVCHSVPVTTCNPRQVETPRKVCHQEYDEIVDTVYTEHCEEVITTTCQQTSTKSILSKQVVGHDSKVVATGVAATAPVTVAHGAPHHGGVVGPAKAVVGPASHHLGKREAEPTAEAEAAFIGPHHIAHPGPAEIHETPAQVSQPVCHSVPVKQCEKIPTHTPR